MQTQSLPLKFLTFSASSTCSIPPNHMEVQGLL